jgi:hypothetical protein
MSRSERCSARRRSASAFRSAGVNANTPAVRAPTEHVTAGNVINGRVEATSPSNQSTMLASAGRPLEPLEKMQVLSFREVEIFGDTPCCETRRDTDRSLAPLPPATTPVEKTCNDPDVNVLVCSVLCACHCLSSEGLAKKEGER